MARQYVPLPGLLCLPAWSQSQDEGHFRRQAVTLVELDSAVKVPKPLHYMHDVNINQHLTTVRYRDLRQFLERSRTQEHLLEVRDTNILWDAKRGENGCSRVERWTSLDGPAQRSLQLQYQKYHGSTFVVFEG